MLNWDEITPLLVVELNSEDFEVLQQADVGNAEAQNDIGQLLSIRGNHDGAVYKGDPAKSLDAFVDNFCTPAPTLNPDTQGAVRTTMDQPGVYFTLNAPFVKFIGLYTNTGEGGTQGVIDSAKVGQPSTARRILSSGSPPGSTTIAFISSSRSKVFGAWKAQLPEPMHCSRSTWIESGIERPR